MPNIVIVFMERLGSTHIGAYGNPLNPTPNLDNLIKTSRWYSNFNVPVHSTARSVFASITGIPDVSAIKDATRNPYITHQRSIINSFDEHHKYYMVGGSAGWANMGALVTNSIDDVALFQEDYWEADTVDVWGISDSSLFLETSNILEDAKTPFLAYIQTAGNHSPFTIPKGESDFVEKELDKEALNKDGFISNKHYNAVRLLDNNIGKMLEIFKQKNLYENTIFVFFADHQASVEKVSYIPEYLHQFGIDSLSVPLIIHGPKFISPEKDTTFGALHDLLPTIAGLLPYPYFNTTLGRDLSWAKGRDLPTFAYIDDTHTSVVTNGKHIASVNHINGEVRTAAINENGVAVDIDNAQTMVDAANAHYKAANFLLKANVKDF